VERYTVLIPLEGLLFVAFRTVSPQSSSAPSFSFATAERTPKLVVFEDSHTQTAHFDDSNPSRSTVFENIESPLQRPLQTSFPPSPGAEKPYAPPERLSLRSFCACISDKGIVYPIRTGLASRTLFSSRLASLGHPFPLN